MKIDSIKISVFENEGNTSRFALREVEHGAYRRWLPHDQVRTREGLHVLHVQTDEGIEGVCTVGDARYTTIRREDLEELRVLAIGEDPFDRERLYGKMRAATRSMFARPGWFGTTREPR